MSATMSTDLFRFDDDDQVSPSDALFPPNLSLPGDFLSPDSLSISPRSSSNPSLSTSGDSPLSFTTDEYLLNNSFGTDALDLLIFPEDDNNLLNTNQNQTANATPSKPQIQETIPLLPQQTFDGLLNQWRMELPQAPFFQQQHQMPQLVVPPSVQQQAPPQPQPQPQAQVQPAPVVKASPAPPPRRSAPNAPLNKRATTPPTNVGKHNKTERRYRQKVQQAQGDLRDAVPALRVLYGTSTEEQKATTDIRAPDGTVDGLGEVTRPNASAKATILIGARMYIELLQRRTATLQRKVDELENFRLMAEGPVNFENWRADFNQREAVIAAQAAALAAAREKDESGEDEEDSDDGEAPRKRKRVTKKAPASNNVRAFAAFAATFALVPSSNVYTPSTAQTAQQLSEMSKGKVLARLPFITAEHSSRLLARALPTALVPSPNLIVDWTMRIFFTMFLVWLFGPLVERAARKHRHKETGAGTLRSMAKDVVSINKPEKLSPEWNALAAQIVGGMLKPSPLVKAHVALRLYRANDAYSLAMLALMAPEYSGKIWVHARAKAEPGTLATVLALPLEEAARSLELVPPTTAPIAAISEQINLVHLYDLYSRFFVRLVSAVGKASTLSGMLAAVKGSDMALDGFDAEIRAVLKGVPRHSTSHALGLVLLGLWGLFSGYASPAVLVSALANEEVQGPPLRSVSVMLELLYPGSSHPQTSELPIPSNAKAIDKLAVACIGFVDLMTGSTEQRRVQKEAARLRLILTQATFVGLDDGEDGVFEDARQKLVGILANVGRAASGRGIRADDSGLETDDEW
ncbi:hypothetical protein A1Q1_07894 [Trichosporon asahii var. asahii CBS 2479]|uniref:Uncharacterized protein n=1 Tax=Trichosporon asahii var. asahii (strain ATCC 90039 / CBS 2479 / JCM 2466 / KCTC 7840 / NBRC 103889/ NCYC 2677 / UAMH 7654) TaxID=1186058 RepID=J5THB4_TRIAS|nr:hypothetical protein A1Q1_07894 [Trichosporon asahii var. asahii CBS 2479]EJT50921.1 hypothetical protein A1Q1_07894 [Trichosporon asahii var. asahii CBS 2479]